MKKKKSKLYHIRKSLNIKTSEIDKYINSHKSTKYKLEENYLNNKMFLYLKLLRINNIDLNKLFDNTFINKKS